MASAEISEIIEEYGEFEAVAGLSGDELSRLPTFFPPVITELLREYGRFTTRKGALQICHPDDMRSVLSLIFRADPDFGHANCAVYAYSSLGSLYFWMKGYGYGVVDLLAGTVFQPDFVANNRDDASAANAALIPFWLSGEALDVTGDDGKPLFARALKKLGPITIGECYGLFPALALGGAASIDHLKRVRAAEHFAIIAQTIDFSLVDNHGYGKTDVVRKIG